MVGSASAQSSFGYNTNVGLITGSGWYTDTVTSALYKNNDWRGVLVYLDINDTLSGGTNGVSVTLQIQGYDETSATYYALLTSAAKTAPGQTLMTVYPGCVAASNTVANLPLPKYWRVQLFVPSADTVKATVGASVIR